LVLGVIKEREVSFSSSISSTYSFLAEFWQLLLALLLLLLRPDCNGVLVSLGTPELPGCKLRAGVDGQLSFVEKITESVSIGED